ncbi:hypothetical protein CSAL01_11453 [Colletotrichum salicis]|uniref:NAD-dependent epimerase/dehydratase domain-containing protein n=1 Tax=Colletotrichum salicis TaxID=1209931 RepID=A0A135UEG9_9PEZI|nr:hypothetical protein CSAL01_11453 [Colletotrichum salicis]
MAKKILVIGGTGLVGGHAALYLRSKRSDVTIAGRKEPSDVAALSELPFIQGDYLNGEFSSETLSEFDAIIFTAGSDVRHVPEGQNADEHYLQANGQAIPNFAKLAKQAGVKKFVHIGSAYPHIIPECNEVASWTRVPICTLDAPFIVGNVPGMVVPMFRAYIDYAKGKLPIPLFAPLGGMNFISTQSLSEAIAGALENIQAISGKAILVGDQNMTYAEYFQMFFQAVGNSQQLESLDQDHPLLPRATLYAGDKVVEYQPDPVELAMLGGFRRDDIQNAIEKIVTENH